MEESAKNELMAWQDFYSRTAEKEGPHMALFYACIAANVPFVVAHLPERIDNPETVWEDYVDRLVAAHDDKKGARDAEWLDGVTDIRIAFGSYMSQPDFAAAIREEKKKIGKLPGTKIQRQRWGLKGNGKAFAEYDYERMDAMLDAYASDYITSGMSQRQEQALIRCVKESYLGEKSSEDGDFRAAQAHYKNADTILAGEAMRAKDEKKADGFRLDACIDALEKAGLAKDGHFLSFEDTKRAIWEFMHKADKPRYGFSLDVADQILLNWENNMRKNSGRAEVFELPADMKLYDEDGEFLPEETDEERILKEQMDLMPVRYQKDGADG